MAPSPLDSRRFRNSCDVCTISKLKCSREKPICQRCVDRGCGQDCNYSLARRPGRRRRTSVVSDDGGLHYPEIAANGTQMAREKGMVPLTPASTFTGSLLSMGRRHDSAQDTAQHKAAQGGGDERTAFMSPEISWMESILGTPMEIPRSGDGETIDFEAINNLSLCDWSLSAVNTGTFHNEQPTPVAHMNGIPSRYVISSGMDAGASTSTGEPKQARSPSLCYSPHTATSNLISDLSKDMDCKCSSQIGQLMYLISLRRAAPIPIDVIFAVDRQLTQTKDTIYQCTNRCLSSPYMSMMVCISMSWVVEHVGTFVCETTAADTPNGHVAYVTVGGLTLSKEMSQACFEALVKLRLKKVFQTARSLTTSNVEANSTLWDGVRSAAAQTGAAAQQMFGMLELRGSA